MKYFSDLKCFENISKVAKQVPSSLLNRWFRVVADIEVQNREPTFYDLMDFVKKEATVEWFPLVMRLHLTESQIRIVLSLCLK